MYRWDYNNLSQKEDEPITKYVARLKSRAVLCNFNVKCKCGEKASYAEEMVSQRLVAGLSNPDHQSRILSEAQDLPDLKTKIERLVSLETTDEAAMKIRATPATASTRSGALKSSQYKKEKRNPGGSGDRVDRKKSFSPRSQPQWRKRCRGCGQTSHANGKPLVRSECPAWGKKCDSCGVENHFAKVCEKRQSRASYMRMDGDTSGNDTSEEESTEDERGDETEDESYHYAARAQVFHKRRHRTHAR